MRTELPGDRKPLQKYGHVSWLGRLSAWRLTRKYGDRVLYVAEQHCKLGE